MTVKTRAPYIGDLPDNLPIGTTADTIAAGDDARFVSPYAGDGTTLKLRPEGLADNDGEVQLTNGAAGSVVTLTSETGSAADTNLYRAAANVLATDDDLSLKTAGKGLSIKEGSNAKMGTATLVGGAATVATTAVGATSRVFLTSQVDGGTPGWLRVSTRTAATSFVITSSSGTDTSTVAWVILDPSA